MLPHRDFDVLRSIEGARMKQSYLIAKQIGVVWKERHYDRARPDAADLPNQALNHASSAVEAAGRSPWHRRVRSRSSASYTKILDNPSFSSMLPPTFRQVYANACGTSLSPGGGLSAAGRS